MKINKYIYILLIVIFSGCSRQSIDIIESYIGIDIPDNIILMTFNTNITDRENFTYYVEIEFDDTTYYKFVNNIKGSILYNEVFDSSNTEEIRENLIKANLTGYWIEAEDGYFFFEPPLGKYPNSVILLDDTFTVEACVINEEFRFYYKFIKFQLEDRSRKK